MASFAKSEPLIAKATWTPGDRSTSVSLMHLVDVTPIQSPVPSQQLPDISPVLIHSGLPTELGGKPNLATPEHYLAAALASCFGLTIQIIAERRNQVTELRAVTGCVYLKLSEKGVPSISHVEVHVTVSRETDVLDGLLLRAEKGCLISQAIATKHPLSIFVRNENDQSIRPVQEGTTP